MAELEEVVYRLEADVSSLTSAMSRVEASMKAGSSAVEGLHQTLHGKLASSMASIATATRLMATEMTLYIAELVAEKVAEFGRALAEQSSEWTKLEGTIRVAIGTHGEARDVMEKVRQIADQTGSPFAALAESYAGTARAASSLGLSQSQLLTLTQSVSLAIANAGTSSAAASRGMTQLNQVFALGTLGAQDFRSIVDDIPGVMQALIEATGKSEGDLKRWATSGKLGAKDIAGALIFANQTLKQQNASIGGSFEKAFQRISDSWLHVVGKLTDQGVFAQPIAMFNYLADSINQLADSDALQSFGEMAKGVFNAIAAAAAPVFDLFDAMTGRISHSADTLKRQIEEVKTSIASADNPSGFTIATGISLGPSKETLQNRLATLQTAYDATQQKSGEASSKGLYKIQGGALTEEQKTAQEKFTKTLEEQGQAQVRLNSAISSGYPAYAALTLQEEARAKAASLGYVVDSKSGQAMVARIAGISALTSANKANADATHEQADIQEQWIAVQARGTDGLIDAKNHIDAVNKVLNANIPLDSAAGKALEAFYESIQDQTSMESLATGLAEARDGMRNLNLMVGKNSDEWAKWADEQAAVKLVQDAGKKSTDEAAMALARDTIATQKNIEATKLRQGLIDQTTNFNKLSSAYSAGGLLGEDNEQLKQQISEQLKGVKNTPGYNSLFDDTYQEKVKERTETALEEAAKNTNSKIVELLFNPFTDTVSALNDGLSKAFDTFIRKGKLSLKGLADDLVHTFETGFSQSLSGLITLPLNTAIQTGAADLGNALTSQSGILGGLSTFGTQHPFLTAGTLGAVGGSLVGGVTGGNSTGGAIGGALGSLGGTFVGGPVGAVVGGLLGSVVGSLFGASGGTGTDNARQVYTPGVGITHRDNKASEANFQASDQLDQQLAAVDKLLGRYGASYVGDAITSNISNKGRKLESGDYKASFNSQAELIAAAVRLITSRATTGGDATLSTILKNTHAQSADELSTQLQFARTYDDLVNPATTDFAKSLRSLQESFADAEQQATELGLSVDKLKDAETTAAQKLYDDAKKQLDQQEQQSADTLRNYFTTLLSPIRTALGAGGINAPYQSAGANLKDFGALYQTTLTQARNDDPNAIQNLSGVAQSYLQQARLYGGSSDTFQAVLRQVNSDLSTVLKTQQDRMTDILSSIPATLIQTAADQIKVLRDGFNDVVKAVADLARDQRLLQAK